MDAGRQNQEEYRRIQWQDIQNPNVKNADVMGRNCFLRVTVAWVKNALFRKDQTFLDSTAQPPEEEK